MPTVGNRNLTLADVSKRLDPMGKVDKVVELLNEVNEIVQDMVVKECNDGTSHKTTVRNGIPAPTWRKLYGGIQSTKSSTEQVKDSCGMLEAMPYVDVDVVDKSGDKEGTLLSENTPHIEGMMQEVAETLFYGDTDLYPERFMGLHQRYNSISADTTKSGYNILDGGGTGADNTSVWLVTWGDNAVHGLYPKGSKAGLSIENLGKETVEADDSSGKYRAYGTHYKWDIGLTVRDWRSVGRIANIDISNLEAESSAADLIKLMIRLSERVKGQGKRVFYMHERVRTMLRLQMLDKSNVYLTYDTIEGKKVLHFDNIPVRICDQILLTEAQIT